MVNTVAGVRIGSKLSVNFMTNFQKLHRGIWPWTAGLKSRLPLHYKRRYIEKFMHEPRPVHYRADDRKFVADKHGNPVRVQNVPIPAVYPRESNEGLWGGEGIVAGFRKKADDPMKPRNARIWLPYLSKRVLYSEILDQWMAVTVTRRTMDLIDAAHGLDNYILSTPEYETRSRFGMLLKRKMLRALADKSMYPDDPAKRDSVYDKYRKYEVPAEEVDWIGLSLYEAERKQNEIEEADRLRNLRPLKDIFADELAQQLKENLNTQELVQPKSWLHKLNPFQDRKTDN